MNNRNRFSAVFITTGHFSVTVMCCSLKCFLSDTVKPLFWSRPVYELDPNNSANNGFINQDFLVWMRRAALPDFRKLYRRITEGDYADGLPAGNYSIEISYSILFFFCIIFKFVCLRRLKHYSHIIKLLLKHY